MAKRKMVDIGEENFNELKKLKKVWPKPYASPSITWLVTVMIQTALPIVKKEYLENKPIKQ